jgi:hypothetical protein
MESKTLPLVQVFHLQDATPLGLAGTYGVSPRVASAALPRRNPGLWDGIPLGFLAILPCASVFSVVHCRHIADLGMNFRYSSHPDPVPNIASALGV